MSASGPDFIVIGAQRAGTTSLYEHLTTHPDIEAAERKEVHFFDDQYWQGRQWYRDRLRTGSGRTTGEATPYYLFHPEVPDRVRATCPDARFIVVLRDPIERAFSHFRMTSGRGWEWLPFDEAIAAENDRVRGEEERLRDPYYLSFPHQHLSYVARGEYAGQLERWFERFPVGQFHVVFASDLYDDARGVMDGVLRFIGVGAAELPPFPHLNVSTNPASISEPTRDRLRAHYAPHDERLASLLGRQVPWFAETSP